MRYVYNDSGLHVEDEYGCLFILEVLFLLLLLSQSFTTAHEILDFCEHDGLHDRKNASAVVVVAAAAAAATLLPLLLMLCLGCYCYCCCLCCCFCCCFCCCYCYYSGSRPSSCYCDDDDYCYYYFCRCSRCSAEVTSRSSRSSRSGTSSSSSTTTPTAVTVHKWGLAAFRSVQRKQPEETVQAQILQLRRFGLLVPSFAQSSRASACPQLQEGLKSLPTSAPRPCEAKRWNLADTKKHSLPVRERFSVGLRTVLFWESLHGFFNVYEA